MIKSTIFLLVHMMEVTVFDRNWSHLMIKQYSEQTLEYIGIFIINFWHHTNIMKSLKNLLVSSFLKVLILIVHATYSFWEKETFLVILVTMQCDWDETLSFEALSSYDFLL